ncbi:MAG: hypothetical protein FWG71_01970 [Synergistaceae bacterium]|nr:hypothetical protein [Synergistaceae bacterium]
MKNIYALKFFFKALFFTVGLLSAGWFFMPWKQVGEAVLLSASARLPEPAFIAYSTAERVAGGVVFNNLEIRNLMGMTDVFFNAVTIMPNAVSSLLGMAPTCRVAFTGAVIGDVAVTPLRKIPGIAPGNGRVTISLNRQGMFLEGLRSDGELSTSGSLLVDLSGMKILWADVAVNIRSEAFEENLSLVGSVFALPLHREAPGRWYLRRAHGSE